MVDNAQSGIGEMQGVVWHVIHHGILDLVQAKTKCPMGTMNHSLFLGKDMQKTARVGASPCTTAICCNDVGLG